MEIFKPTEAELAGLLAEHANRYPEKALIRVIGDGGVEVALPFLIGNPTGACKMSDGAHVSQAWADTVVATFKLRAGTESDVTALAADCVLWPPSATWFEWAARWAALPDRVFALIRRKVGAEMATLDEPQKDEKPPAALATVLQRNPSAVWRKLNPPGGEFCAVIAPPDPGVWRLFISAMKKRDEKHVQVARDLAEASIIAIVTASGEPAKVADVFDRWPGQPLIVGLVVSYLAGLSGDFDLGECWAATNP